MKDELLTDIRSAIFTRLDSVVAQRFDAAVDFLVDL